MTTPESGLTTGRNVGYQTGVRNMRYLILATSIATSLLLCAAVPAHAQVSVGIQSHGVSIGFNVSAYPRMVAIPGYPVYYDPRMTSNYFFYDGLYWVYQDNNWYSSGWYDGPWDQIGPQYVPAFVLRVPVRYYGQRPAYFGGWSVDVAPHWGEYWGNDWQQQRRGWDSWDRHSVYQAAPLPAYQAQYSGSHYPRAVDQQYSIQSTNYRYQPREAVAQQYYQRHVVTSATRNETVQHAPSQQKSHGKQQQQERGDQAQQQSHAQQQKQERASAQAQQQSHAQQQQKQEHAKDQAQQQQAHSQQQKQEHASAQAQQQSHAQQQQKQEHASAQAQQQSHAQQQQKQERASAQAQQQSHAQQQQQQRSNDQAQQQSHSQQQQQQHAQQQAPAQQGPSNEHQPRQQSVAKDKNSGQKSSPQDKDKSDKKDGGGGGNPNPN
jgi:hypothetical protein